MADVVTHQLEFVHGVVSQLDVVPVAVGLELLGEFVQSVGRLGATAS